MYGSNTLAAYFQVIPTVSFREGIYVTIGIFEAHCDLPNKPPQFLLVEVCCIHFHLRVRLGEILLEISWEVKHPHNVGIFHNFKDA